MTTTAFTTTFTSVPGLDLRSIDREGSPWFVAADVCKVLDLRVQDAIRRLEADEVGLVKGGLNQPLIPNRGAITVSESGLYALIMRSRKPEAKAFQKWVTGTVLPAIRKNGGYMNFTPVRC